MIHFFDVCCDFRYLSELVAACCMRGTHSPPVSSGTVLAFNSLGSVLPGEGTDFWMGRE